MKKIKAVIFDMDGVIFDTECLWKEYFVLANKEFNANISEEYRQSICGKSEEAIRNELKELYPELDADEYREFMLKGVRQAISEGCFETKDGFETIVAFLKEKGCGLALATSSRRARAESMFEKKGYRKENIFDVFVFGDDVGTRCKPDPYVFEIAAERLGVSHDECMVLEDSLNGIKAAAEGGFVAVMVKDLIPPDDYCKRRCSLIADSFMDVKKYLENII
ncbi:MAG: HAD family phosphatase [Ruminococcaceae bacterium]|nr:HAD family phosphatase [Oscillospiraceae bacterium]